MQDICPYTFIEISIHMATFLNTHTNNFFFLRFPTQTSLNSLHGHNQPIKIIHAYLDVDDTRVYYSVFHFGLNESSSGVMAPQLT